MTDQPAYDPSAIPGWARETITQIARKHPGYLTRHLHHVAGIEAARRHAAGHPAPPPPPVKPDDLFHLASIQAWQALASGQPAPDPEVLQAAIHDAFATSDGTCQPGQICESWLHLARQRSITMHDEHGDLLPGVRDAITRTMTAAIWFEHHHRVPDPWPSDRSSSQSWMGARAMTAAEDRRPGSRADALMPSADNVAVAAIELVLAGAGLPETGACTGRDGTAPHQVTLSPPAGDALPFPLASSLAPAGAVSFLSPLPGGTAPVVAWLAVTDAICVTAAIGYTAVAGHGTGNLTEDSATGAGEDAP